MKTVIGIFAVIVLLITVIGATTDLLTARAWSDYRPGDCLRTPITKAHERWQPSAASEIVMIADVGEHNYMTRGWGGGFTKPHWYDYYETKAFRVLDDGSEWELIPCPEEQPDERLLEAKDRSDDNIVLFTSTSDGDATGTVIFRNNVFTK